MLNKMSKEQTDEGKVYRGGGGEGLLTHGESVGGKCCVQLPPGGAKKFKIQTPFLKNQNCRVVQDKSQSQSPT